VVAGLVLWSIEPKEPDYHGRSLSFWLNEWSQSYYDRTNAACVAIRAIGSNGVPILLARLSKEQSSKERKFWINARKVVPCVLDPVYQKLDPTDRNVQVHVEFVHRAQEQPRLL
jgi:hypothetical protein